LPDQPPAPLDRRALLRRMAIGGAAVWATPMMTSVASAQEAASCGDGVLDWDNFTTGSYFTNTIVGNTTISLGISGVSPANALTTDNAQIFNVNAGNIPGKSLRFAMNATNASANNGNRQTITFAFSNPVTNVMFTLMDIDNSAGDGWGDRVVMITPGYTFAPAFTTGATRVIGNGTNDDRFRNLNTDNNLGNNSSAGNVTIRYAGPISAFQFTYRNQVNSGEPQRIDLSDITFTC
jgi:hypothetical protein